MSTTRPTERASEHTIGELRLATNADGQYVEVRTCPFCGLKFRDFGVHFSEHWPTCEANDLEPLAAVAAEEGDR